MAGSYGRTAAQAPEIDGVVYVDEAPLEPGELAPFGSSRRATTTWWVGG